MPGAIRFITAISWRRANARRRAGHGIPGAPFLYGRGRRRNLVPRFAVHRFRNAAPADRRRRTHGPTGRIHHPGLSCGQTRPLAGRSRGRHHRLVLAGVARARRQPDARGLFRSVRHPARKTAAPHLAAGTRTRLLGRGGRIRRPHPAARHHAADQGADRRPAQLVFARQRHQGGSRRSHRRSAERRKKHLAQPPAQRRTGHGLGHRRHDARRHRRARQHRRDRFRFLDTAGIRSTNDTLEQWESPAPCRASNGRRSSSA